MDRDRIIEILVDGTSAAATGCRTALLADADLIVWPGGVAADRMLATYSRRHRQAVAGDTPTVGFPEALEALREAGHLPLKLGQVTAADPAFVYIVFIRENPAAVIACLGISQAAS